jgi:mannose-6-phosphate isomerase
MYKLKCAVQNYDWGQKGSDSLVARIFSANGGSVDENKKYAEYWMGTHINGASLVEFSSDDKVKLSDFMKEKYGSLDGLPFLFKVLSIKEPLSIQLHPDKQMAEILHKEEPSLYKDPNHKPEMAIVLSDLFEMFYGLLKINDALELVKILLPYFKASQSEAFNQSCEGFLIDKTEESYKFFLKLLILLQENEYKAVIKAINDSFEELAKSLENEFFSSKIKLFKEFIVIFKEDRGLLFSMFMNYLLLKQGDFIFINANVPHAYIRGNCAECMANSDNVIRLGLTPKFVDATNFLKVHKILIFRY